MKFILAVLVFALSLPVHAQGSRSNRDAAPQSGPLEDLLARIPADAAGSIYLADLAAAYRQVSPLITDTPSDFHRALIPISSAYLPAALDQQSLARFPDGGADALGFSVFDLHQVAGWGTLPDSPLIATGVSGSRDLIAEKLAARGFEATQTHGQTVWHLLDDLEMDAALRNSDPLSAPLGRSQRIALDRGLLLFARTWPAINTLLDPGTTLATETGTASILRAGYALRGAGDLLGAVIVQEPPTRGLDPGLLLRLGADATPEEIQAELDRMPGASLPGLPPFLRYGLLLWQDGYRTTGAVVIPYIRRDTAETARERFTALLDTAESPSVKRPFAQLLPHERRFEIVPAKDRNVLVLAFTTSADRSKPVDLSTFMDNPRRMLMQMLMRRELSLLIGAAP